MLLALENGVNFLEGAPLSLDPINGLWDNVVSEKSRDGGARTYNQNDYNDVPRGINHIHLPTNIFDTDWHDEDQKKSKQVNQDAYAGTHGSYARPFRTNCENATPFALMEKFITSGGYKYSSGVHAME